ncbi:MAG: hypothetical protein E7462_06230 [Ruminococcaceae bacterium]|nr:hypothetical protein [Oscillospiraceae bacterium]
MFKQKKLSLGARFGLACASVALAVLLFFATVAAILVVDVRTAVSEDSLRVVARQLFMDPVRIQGRPALKPGNGGVSAAPVSKPVLNMPRLDNPDSLASSLSEQLVDMLYEELDGAVEGGLTVSQKELENLIEESTVKDYMADKTAALISDYLMGEVNTTFEAEEIIQLIDENKELIEEITGEPLPEDIKETVTQVFKENEIIQKVEAEGLAGFMELASGSPDSPDGELPGAKELDILNQMVGIVRTLSSTGTLLTVMAGMLVLIVAILFTNLRQLAAGLRRCGYPVILAGLLFLLIPILFAIMPQEEPWVMVAQSLYGTLTTVHILFLVGGFALLAGGIVLGILVSIKRKAALVAAVVTAPVKVVCAAVAASAEETPEPEEEVQEAVEEPSSEEESEPVTE